MKKSRFLVLVVLLAVVSRSAYAGIFFRKSKPNPAERVPALIITLKTEKNDGKREAAAQELREYDPTTFPEIVPVLIDVLQHDEKAGVRLEAVQSLGRLRPISREAGWAIEQAAENDASMRVRLQGRSSLIQYRLAGFHPNKSVEPPPSTTGVKTEEPPLASPPSASSRRYPSGPNTPVAQDATAPRLVPVNIPSLQTPPPAPAKDDGPELTPPNK